MVRVSSETKEKLTKLKIMSQEPYDGVIKRLIHAFEFDNKIFEITLKKKE